MARIRKVVFDIETANSFDEVGSTDAAKLDISIVGAYDSATDTYDSYSVPELPRLWAILEKADILIGYNSDHFDIPLLNKYYPGDLTTIKSIDLLVEVREVLGRRLKLDTIAEATLGSQKSGHGLDAIRWWKDGEEEKVRKYCLDDVRLTKELYDYIRTHKKILYKDFGELKEVKLKPQDWEKNIVQAALTHTMPF